MFLFSLFHVFIPFYFIRRNTRTPRKMSASEVSPGGRTPISFLNIFKAVQGYFDLIVLIQLENRIADMLPAKWSLEEGIG